MDDRQGKLNDRITEYENRIKVIEYNLRNYKQTLKSLREELEIHMDGKQGELI